MRSGMSWIVVGLLLLLGSPAQAQLKDTDFRVTDGGDFSDKVMFAAPAKAPDKPGPLWSGSGEFGVFGNEGNSNVFKIRIGGNARRCTENNIFTTDLIYGVTRQRQSNLENKALLNLRDEWLFKDSPWGVFVAGQLEYDEFRAFDFRVAAHSGVAYQIWKTDNSSIRGRIGAGFQREVGGPKNDYVPEGLVGADFFHRLTERQRIVGSIDYYPALDTSGEYRVRFRAAWECLIEPSCNLILRVGVQDRYDSEPGPSKRNDLDYFTTLGVKF